jgi:hypothetical protein
VNADVDVVAQTAFGDRRFRAEVHQVGGRDEHVFALLADLIRLVAEHLDEFFHRDRHETRMGDPAAVVTVAGIACLVRAHTAHGLFVAAGSFLIGISALMPPIAGALRRWQVFSSSSAYARMNGEVMVICERSARQKSRSLLNFLIAEKM